MYLVDLITGKIYPIEKIGDVAILPSGIELPVDLFGKRVFSSKTECYAALRAYYKDKMRDAKQFLGILTPLVNCKNGSDNTFKIISNRLRSTEHYVEIKRNAKKVLYKEGKVVIVPVNEPSDAQKRLLDNSPYKFETATGIYSPSFTANGKGEINGIWFRAMGLSEVPNVIYQVADSLEYLSLSQNYFGVGSITDAFRHIKMPRLKVLWLDGNKPCSYRWLDFKKVFPELKILYI